MSNELLERMKRDYKADMERKDKEIAFLKAECKRVYDPIRKFWNQETKEKIERLEMMIEEDNDTIKKLISHLDYCTTLLKDKVVPDADVLYRIGNMREEFGLEEEKINGRRSL